MQTQYSDLKKYFKNQTAIAQKILSEFKKPIFKNSFFTNLDLLRLNSEKIEFSNNSWNMRPEKFCLDYYKEPFFSPVILITNNIPTFFQFRLESFNKNKNQILAPQKSIIVKITQTINDVAEQNSRS